MIILKAFLIIVFGFMCFSFWAAFDYEPVVVKSNSGWEVTVGEPFKWDRPLPPGVVYQAERQHKYILIDENGVQIEITKEEWEKQ